jgi:hypothetical protein
VQDEVVFYSEFFEKPEDSLGLGILQILVRKEVGRRKSTCIHMVKCGFVVLHLAD